MASLQGWKTCWDLESFWTEGPLGNKALVVSKDILLSYWCPSRGHKERKIVEAIGEKKRKRQGGP